MGMEKISLITSSLERLRIYIKMAKSLKSKVKRKNRQIRRKQLKPKDDAKLQAIVATMQEQTDNLMATAGDSIDVSAEVKIVEDNGSIGDQPDNEQDVAMDTVGVSEKKKIPHVDIRKLTKFMSQRKLRRFKEKEKSERKRVKQGKKK